MKPIHALAGLVIFAAFACCAWVLFSALVSFVALDWVGVTDFAAGRLVFGCVCFWLALATARASKTVVGRNHK